MLCRVCTQRNFLMTTVFDKNRGLLAGSTLMKTAATAPDPTTCTAC
jgi:hypothetical protein